MQGWMIALITAACVIAVIAISVIVTSLVFVHNILGRRKTLGEKARQKKGYSAEKYGVNTSWFDAVAENTRTDSLTAFDGIKLSVRKIEHSPISNKVAVLCHGYGSTVSSMQPQAQMFWERGFDVYILAMRGHIGSEGKVGMAWLDRFDLLRLIDKVIAEHGSGVRIALMGVSMGGSTVVSVAGMDPPPQVKCVIDDCGFSSQAEEYAACIANVKLPKSFIHLFNMGVRLVHGYSLFDADICPLAANMTIPALFIHGEDDKFVPTELGKKLYDSCSSPQKTFLIFPGAAHALSYASDKERYAAEFTAFIDKHIG